MTMIMCFNNKIGWSKGWYSEHVNKDSIVEMEASVVAKMTVDKINGFGFEDYILVFKHDDDLSWWEITKGVKLESFCNRDYKFGFIKTESIIK
ncbi:MAG: hypothetical protein RSB94_07275 [Erysipelotrichaceae bacterium]